MQTKKYGPDPFFPNLASRFQAAAASRQFEGSDLTMYHWFGQALLHPWMIGFDFPWIIPDIYKTKKDRVSKWQKFYLPLHSNWKNNFFILQHDIFTMHRKFGQYSWSMHKHGQNDEYKLPAPSPRIYLNWDANDMQGNGISNHYNAKLSIYPFIHIAKLFYRRWNSIERFVINLVHFINQQPQTNTRSLMRTWCRNLVVVVVVPV
jgi:hypothetical protein